MKNVTNVKIIIILLFLLLFISYPFCNRELIAIENKKTYLILVEKERDKALYEKYIRERKELYNVLIYSLEEKNIKNQPKDIKVFLKELYSDFPFYYAAFDENIAYSTILFYGSNWEKNVRSDNEYANLDDDKNFIPEFYIGRITHSFLEKQWKSLPKQSVLFALPVLHYDHYVSRCRGYWTSWCDLRFIGYEYKNYLTKSGIDFTEMYENRYSYRQASTYGTIQLNKDNFQNIYKTSSLIISTSTCEPLIIDLDEITYSYTQHSNLFTATWEDRDKDKWVDLESKEVNIESFCNFKELKGYEKRIWILPTLTMPETLNNLYCAVSRFNDVFPSIWYQRDNQGRRDSYTSGYCMIIDKLLSGDSISKCVFDSFNDYSKKYNTTNFSNLTYFVFGPPETTLNDLVNNAKLKIKPIDDENLNEINIPRNQDSIKLILQNIGSSIITYNIEFDNNTLNISNPIGTIEQGKEQIVNISLIKIPIQTNSSPKHKQSTINIKSNAGDRKIIVRWVGI